MNRGCPSSSAASSSVTSRMVLTGYADLARQRNNVTSHTRPAGYESAKETSRDRHAPDVTPRLPPGPARPPVRASRRRHPALRPGAVLVLCGLAKFTDAEAQTIHPWVTNSPFLGWL